jgi:hypothetical protein
MTDPYEGLTSFQQALLNGEISLRSGEVHPDLYLHVDYPNPNVPRFTYVRLDGQMVTALAMITPAEPMDGLRCFQAGVAVPEAHRGKGHAKSIVAAAIAELKHGLARNGIRSFYVKAIVSIDNEPSKRVARSTICEAPSGITDSVSGLPALHYVRKIDEGNGDDASI